MRLKEIKTKRVDLAVPRGRMAALVVKHYGETYVLAPAMSDAYRIVGTSVIAVVNLSVDAAAVSLFDMDSNEDRHVLLPSGERVPLISPSVEALLEDDAGEFQSLSDRTITRRAIEWGMDRWP